MTVPTGQRTRLYGIRPPGLLCAVEGCERSQESNVYCKLHYERWRKHGDPLVVKTAAARKPGDMLSRLANKFVVGDGCWAWVSAKDRDGYGLFWLDNARRAVRAHRLLYELLVGPIPPELQIDHLCRNTGCVRPDHLEPVTAAENSRRRDLAK